MKESLGEEGNESVKSSTGYVCLNGTSQDAISRTVMVIQNYLQERERYQRRNEQDGVDGSTERRCPASHATRRYHDV